MRADQAIMLAVVGLGGFALVRMLSNKGANAPSTDPNMLPPVPNPDQGPSVSTTKPETNLSYLSDPLSLRWGGWYRGRLNTDSSLPPFGPDASRELLAQALGILGFQNIQVFMSPSELPPNWPASEVSTSPNARYFAFRWGQPDAQLPRPAALEAMWVSTAAANPAPSTSGFDGVSIVPTTDLLIV